MLTEQLDRFLLGGNWVNLPVLGAFEFKGDRISAWRDYFDMNQFTSQLSGSQQQWGQMSRCQ